MSPETGLSVERPVLAPPGTARPPPTAGYLSFSANRRQRSAHQGRCPHANRIGHTGQAVRRQRQEGAQYGDKLRGKTIDQRQLFPRENVAGRRAVVGQRGNLVFCQEPVGPDTCTVNPNTPALSGFQLRNPIRVHFFIGGGARKKAGRPENFLVLRPCPPGKEQENSQTHKPSHAHKVRSPGQK